MRRIVSIVLVCVLLLSGCANSKLDATETTKPYENTELAFIEIADEAPKFSGLEDQRLLQYVEDCVYSDLVYAFDSEDFIVESINTTYVSKEYLEELDYNSKENVYFGYKLSEIDAQFEGTRYVFSLSDEGTTIVREFEKYDNDYEQIIKNVAVGTGVILVCVTVSIVSGVMGASTVSLVFAASAKTGTNFALSSSVFSAVTAGVVTQIQTGNFEEAVKSASLKASEGFKWGAIAGAIFGGANKTLDLYKASKAVPTPRESEIRVLNKYGGSEQLSYLNGQEVPISTQNATRPDVIRYNNGVLEAIEVKNYNLNQGTSRNTLYKELERQVSSRVKNLPEGSTQRIVLDVKGRGYSEDLIQSVVNNIKVKCANIYPNIPVDILY